MGRNAISITSVSKSLHLSECHDGFWLYDDTRGMNLSMRAKTRNDAFVEALTYYQNRLQVVEERFNSLNSKVDAFVSQFTESEPDND